MVLKYYRLIMKTTLEPIGMSRIISRTLGCSLLYRLAFLLAAPTALLQSQSMSVTPSSGTGLVQQFKAVYSGQSGSAVRSAQLSISATTDTTNACFISYEVSSKKLTLLTDAGQSGSSITPGGPGALKNSQCSVPAASASVSSQNGNLALSVTITFSSSYQGLKTIYMGSTGLTGRTSGLTNEGIWTPVATSLSLSMTPTMASLAASQSQQFTSKVIGPTNPDVWWAISPQVGTISASGLYVAPTVINVAQTVTVTATISTDWTKTATALVTLTPAVSVTKTQAVSMTVTPSGANLRASGTQQFTPTVTGSANTGVSWSISPQVGTISATGMYTAPATLNSAQTITVTATSAADSTKTATASITLTPVVSVTMTPSSASLTASRTQQFTPTVTGSANTSVSWSLSPQVGTISTSGLYTAPAALNGAQTITVTATSAADSTKTATASITLTPVVSVTMTPSSASLAASGTQQFTPTVTGSANTSVAWSITPQVGTISASGMYTAPTTLNSAQTVTVTATSAADSTKTVTASITLTPVVSVTVTPPSASLTASGAQQFTPTVTGSANTSVSPSLSPQSGNHFPLRLVHRPRDREQRTNRHRHQCSAADSTKTATASIALTVPVDKTAPTISLTAPANGSKISGSITISATASDNVGVAGVQFFVDSTALGSELAAAPFPRSGTRQLSPTGHTPSPRQRGMRLETGQPPRDRSR